ncbi:early nodulin-like protein 7 [Euphorbia peplus]|nr:early nodulin-like protein 7 [Euphorbia peplus]
MASFTSICFLIFLVSVVDAAKVFKVGGELGWHEPGGKNPKFYTEWAENNRFRIGDSLLFEYQNDSVVEVEKWGYYHCNTSGSIVHFNNGRSTINLEKSGLFFFISGAPNHCRNGQRLIVDVMGLHHQRSSPPSIANPPESYLAPSESPQSTLEHSSSGSAAFSVGFGSVLVVLFITIVVAFVGSA